MTRSLGGLRVMTHENMLALLAPTGRKLEASIQQQLTALDAPLAARMPAATRSERAVPEELRALA